MLMPSLKITVNQARARLRRRWSLGALPQHIIGVLEQAASRFREKDAIVCDELRLSFSQLKEQVERVSVGLVELGVHRGDWVGIMLPNCSEFVVSFLALARVGAVVVPLDVYHKQPELEKLLRRAGISSLITAVEFLKVAEPVARACPEFQRLILREDGDHDFPTLEGILKTQPTTLNRIVQTRPKDDLLFLCTSGTTGTPKGILLSHSRVVKIGRAWRIRYPIDADDKCFNLAPLFRSPALLSVVVGGLCYGITMVIPSAFRPGEAWKQIASENVSFFHANPFHFAALANTPVLEHRPPPAFKHCYSTGNRLSRNVANKFFDRFRIRIEERYGTSETGGICKDGWPLTGVHIKLVDDKGRTIRTRDQSGEIVVKTPTMAAEYHNQPEQTRKVFKNRWFHTGDVGRFEECGRLEILYRKKTVVQVDGKQVYPDEVERLLCCHPKVKGAMVTSGEPAQRDVKLHVMVVSSEPCSAQELLEYCASRLEPHKIPNRIEFRDELPRSWKTVDAGLTQAYPKWGEY